MSTKAKVIDILKEPLTPGSVLNFAEIGRQVGVSRERVRFIAKLIDQPKIPKGFVPSKVAEKELGYSHTRLKDFATVGRIQWIKLGTKVYFNPKSYQPKTCPVCGKSVPRGRAVYSSEECRQAALPAIHKKGSWRRFHARWKIRKEALG